MNYICLNCKNNFTPHKTSIAKKFCSRSCANKSRIGQPGWMAGLKGVRSGKDHPMWGKTRKDMIGDKNPNWKEGNSLKNKNARLGNELRHWRLEVFSRDNYTCQICNIKGKEMHADHINSWASYPELRYEISNGRSLCVPCHYYVTFKKKMPIGITWGKNLRKRIVSL